MSVASSASHAVSKPMSSRGPDALVTREVDLLVSRLLGELNVPYGSLGTRVIAQLTDLKKILSTDYMEVPALPPKPLLKELAHIVESDIKKHTSTYGGLADLGSPALMSHLEHLFGPREARAARRALSHRRGIVAARFLLPRRCRSEEQVRDFREHRASSGRGRRDSRT